MAITLGSPRETASEINVTPLIDVLLVLLIIFMVILPQHHNGEKTEVPQPTTEPISGPEEAIVIQLREAGAGQRPTLAINHQEVTWDNLEARLRDIYLRRMDKIAFVKGDPEIDFQYVAELVDTTHHAGITRVGLLGAND